MPSLNKNDLMSSSSIEKIWNPFSTFIYLNNLKKLKSELPEIVKAIDAVSTRSNQDFDDFDEVLAPHFDRIFKRSKKEFCERMINILVYRTMGKYMAAEDMGRSPEQETALENKYINYFLSKDIDFSLAKKVIPFILEKGTLEHYKAVLKKFTIPQDSLLNFLKYISSNNLDCQHYYYTHLLSTAPSDLTRAATLFSLAHVLSNLEANNGNGFAIEEKKLIDLFLDLNANIHTIDYKSLRSKYSSELKDADKNYYNNTNLGAFAQEMNLALINTLIKLDYSSFKTHYMSSEPSALGSSLNYFTPNSSEDNEICLKFPLFSLLNSFFSYSSALRQCIKYRSSEDFIELLNFSNDIFNAQDMTSLLNASLAQAVNVENLPLITLFLNRNQTVQTLKQGYPNISQQTVDNLLLFINPSSINSAPNSLSDLSSANSVSVNNVDYENLLDAGSCSPALLAHIVKVGTLTNHEKATIVNFCLTLESLPHYNAVKDLNFFDINYTNLFELIKSANNAQEAIDYSQASPAPRNELNEIIMDFFTRENNADFYLQANARMLLPLSEPLLNFLKIQKEKSYLVAQFANIPLNTPLNSLTGASLTPYAPSRPNKI